LQEQQRRKENNPAKTYVPNGKAEEFIKLVGSDEKFVNMFIGANGTSKTSTAVNIITNIVFGVQSEWFEYPLFQEWPYIKKGRIISDPTTIKEKIIPELEKWFPVNESKKIPQANFETKKEGKNYVCKIQTKTGWTIDIMSSEQDTKEFESVDLGFCAIDEPIPKDKFLATIARARLGMIIFWTFTPLTYSAWIKNWMDEQRDTGMADYIEAEMPDNCKLHGVRGFFEHKHIKRIADSYPEDEKEARVFGKFGHLIGRVHKGFTRKVHVIKPFAINVRNFTIYQALDPHPRAADHTLYMAVRSNGQRYIIGELIHDGVNEKAVSRMVERMKAYESSKNMRVETRIIDPSAFNDDEHKKEKSVGVQFFDKGIHFIKGSKDLMGCIKKTDEALTYQKKKGLMVIHPKVYIFDTCPVAIKQIEEYVWSEWKGSSKDEKQANARPKDINDHQVENLHRLLIHPTPFISYQLRRSNVIPARADSDIADHGFDPYG